MKALSSPACLPVDVRGVNWDKLPLFRMKSDGGQHRVRIPTMSITHSDLMPIRAERSDAGLSQCETLIGIRQHFCHFC